MNPSPITVRVLLVEDEVLIQDLLQETLRDGGYDVVTADNVEEAFARLDEEGGTYGGLVTDVNLGGDRSGWDVARRARELNSKLAIVYISGDSAYQWASQGVPNSAVLTKPFAPAQLVVALASLATKIDAGI
jgi:DNA-binding response OmpR family regulator